MAAAHGPEGFLGAAVVAFGGRRGGVLLQLRPGAHRRQQAERRRQHRPAPPRQQRQTGAHRPGQQQAGRAQEPPGELQAAHQPPGGAAEGVQGVPGEQVAGQRQAERPGRHRPQAGGGRHSRPPTDQLPDRCPRRQRGPQQQRRAGGQGHVRHKVLLLPGREGIPHPQQLAQGRAVLLDRLHPAGLVDLEFAGEVVVQQRHQKAGVEQAERPRRAGQPQQRRPAEGGPGQHQRRRTQAEHRHLKAEQVALQHAGKPQHQQRRPGQPGGVGVQGAPEPGRRQRQKGQRRVLAQSGPVGDIAEAVGRQGVERRRPESRRPGQRQPPGRIVAAPGGEEGDGEQVQVVGYGHRHARQPQQRRGVQQQVAVKDPHRIAVAQQPVRLDAHRELPVGQAHGDVFDPPQVVAQVGPVPDPAGQKRPAGQQRRRQQPQPGQQAAQRGNGWMLVHGWSPQRSRPESPQKTEAAAQCAAALSGLPYRAVL